MLSPAQRQLGRHKCAERAKRVIKSFGNQRVRSHNRRRTRRIRMHWRGIFFRIEQLLSLNCLHQLLVRLGKRYGFYPRHRENPLSLELDIGKPTCSSFVAQSHICTRSSFLSLYVWPDYEFRSSPPLPGSLGNPVVHSLSVTLGNHAIRLVQPYNCPCPTGHVTRVCETNGFRAEYFSEVVVTHSADISVPAISP
jgi:hypothetical protein